MSLMKSLDFHFLLHLFIFYHVRACMWQSEDNLRELTFSFHYVGPGNLTQVIRLGTKNFYL